MPHTELMVGNKAVAYGAKLARVQVVSAYPITPQTTIVQYLAEFIANGELAARFIEVESELSAMVAVQGASFAGARVFTATSGPAIDAPPDDRGKRTSRCHGNSAPKQQKHGARPQ